MGRSMGTRAACAEAVAEDGAARAESTTALSPDGVLGMGDVGEGGEDDGLGAASGAVGGGDSLDRSKLKGMECRLKRLTQF